jgi:hypothetical protein
LSGEIVPPPPARGRSRLFQPGQSGNLTGRRRGSRNKATLAAAALAVEPALAEDMSLAAVGNGEIAEPSPQNAERGAGDECGHHSARLRRDHAGRVGNDRRGLRNLCANRRHCQEAGRPGQLLQILTAGDDVEDEHEDIADADSDP